MIRISVLCPTRGRPEKLRTSVASLLDNADNPGQAEILLAVDPDEAHLEFPEPALVWAAPRRYGYQSLHEYYNRLADRARGDWLMVWNDDAVMYTPGWDTVVVNHEPAFLFPGHNGPMHCNGFPIWPAEWTRLLGHVSLGAYVDTWMQEICEVLDVQRRVPIEVTNAIMPDDQTWREGRAVTPYGHSFQAEQRADLEKLRKYLQAKGAGQ